MSTTAQRRVLGRWRLRLPALIAAVVILVWAPSAAAQTLARGSSAVDQYEEDIPGSGGTHHGGAGGPISGGGGGSGGGGSGGGESGTVPLSQAAATHLKAQGGPNGWLLKRLALSPAYGAPVGKLSRDGSSPPGANASGSASPLSAVVTAVGEGGSGGRLVGLILALGLISIAALGLMATRARHTSRT